MGNDIKYRYERHIRDTAPDMEKLWNRIDEEIDKAEQAETKKNYENIRLSPKPKLSVYLTAAAAALAVIVGIGIFTHSSNPDTSSNDAALVSQGGAAQVQEAEGTQRSEAVKETDAPEENLVPAETADNITHETNGIQATEEWEDKTTDAAMAEEADDETTQTVQIIRYSSLAFSETTTVNYVETYEPSGDEFFVESKVLEETEVFADVTVEEARLDAQGGEYVLRVNGAYSRDGETQPEEITIRSTTPYILQENREYLIPLKQEGGSWYIVFENAPQIEITLDGSAVFQNGWSIESEADVQADERGANDFYYDRMKYCSADDLEGFIQSWKQL